MPRPRARTSGDHPRRWLPCFDLAAVDGHVPDPPTEKHPAQRTICTFALVILKWSVP